MRTKMIKTISAITLALVLSISATGCTKAQVGSGNTATTQVAGTKASSGKTATSAFDADGTATLNGGNVNVNGQKIT